MTTKIDYKRDLECYKVTRDTPQVVTMPDLRYLMIDGHGDPNAPAVAEATATLYPVAYKLKFASKKTLGRDYVVMPLEGLWSWSTADRTGVGSRRRPAGTSPDAALPRWHRWRC